MKSVLNKIFPVRLLAEIDKYSIEYEKITSLDLMERAAAVWCGFFLKKFASPRKIQVLAGNGNNGGDGYVIARLLLERGYTVFVCRVVGEMHPDCAENYHRYRKLKGEVVDIACGDDLKIIPDAIIIDALFGSGLNRKLSGIWAESVRMANCSGNVIVSVDMPSGLMGEDNSENDREAIIEADYTFTFHFPKLAFMFAENERYVGKWCVLDIGLLPEAIEAYRTPYYCTDKEIVSRLLPLAGQFAHKGINGHGLLMAGSYGMMGAAVLAAKAVVRSGIGLLTCHVPQCGVDIMQSAVPEALAEADASLSLISAVGGLEKYSAVAAGPGIGGDIATVEVLKKVLSVWRGRTILDADALNMLSEHREMLDMLHENCILTPHPKEFERLAGKSENDFERLNKLSNFAARYRVYVILKGAYTIIASPSGECYFNMSGNPGMAKGGMGDCLTGVLLALAANGMSMLHVALVGVFAHGLAGDIMARERGMRGVSSGEVAENMGKAWRELEENAGSNV